MSFCICDSQQKLKIAVRDKKMVLSGLQQCLDIGLDMVLNVFFVMKLKYDVNL